MSKKSPLPAAEANAYHFLAAAQVRYIDEDDQVKDHTLNTMLQGTSPQIHAHELSVITKSAHQRACQELGIAPNKVTNITILNIQLLSICPESVFHGTAAEAPPKSEVH